jgi:hypothetical protein
VYTCLFRTFTNMLMNGKAFDGSTFHYDMNDRLKRWAGRNIDCFTTFNPLIFPNHMMIFRFLNVMYKLKLCCFLTGTFVGYVAGIYDSFDGAILFMALTQNPHISTLFQRHDDFITHFRLNEFKFELIGFRQGYDVFRYIVSCEDFCMPFLVVGIDITEYTSPLCNVDFVDFCWQNYRRFSFKKYALTILPICRAPIPRLLCLQYYRAKSDGWRDIGNCDECIEENELALLPLTNCTLHEGCQCGICVRQPPSLVNLASHILLNYTVTTPVFLYCRNDI